MTVVSTMRNIGVLGAVALAAAVLPGAAVAGGGSSAAIEGGGVVQLHLGNDGDYVKFSPPSGQPPSVQPIVEKKCVATLAASPSLVDITSEPGLPAGAVGLFDHSLGVKTAGEGVGTPCSRVDGLSQKLRLSLSGSLKSSLISFAELDVEGKSGVTVLADAYVGTRLVGSSSLPTGPVSDSGPDSADGDNFRWLIKLGEPFDTLLLRVDPLTPGGSFSLEGGADGTAPLPDGVGDGSARVTPSFSSPSPGCSTVVRARPPSVAAPRRRSTSRVDRTLNARRSRTSCERTRPVPRSRCCWRRRWETRRARTSP